MHKSDQNSYNIGSRLDWLLRGFARRVATGAACLTSHLTLKSHSPFLTFHTAKPPSISRCMHALTHRSACSHGEALCNCVSNCQTSQMRKSVFLNGIHNSQRCYMTLDFSTGWMTLYPRLQTDGGLLGRQSGQQPLSPIALAGWMI